MKKGTRKEQSEGPQDPFTPRDVTPKDLRGREVRVLRVLTGFEVSPYTGQSTPRYRWRVQVPWGVHGWRPAGVFPKLRRAVETAWKVCV